MWNNRNDKIYKLYTDFINNELKIFPAECPICSEKSAHIYLHRWPDGKDKGALWTWCSECKEYSHYTVKIPKQWENYEDILFGKLNHEPNYLEENKEIIDSYINELVARNNDMKI